MASTAARLSPRGCVSLPGFLAACPHKKFHAAPLTTGGKPCECRAARSGVRSDAANGLSSQRREVGGVGDGGAGGAGAFEQSCPQPTAVLVTPDQFTQVLAGRPVVPLVDPRVDEDLEIVGKLDVHCGVPGHGTPERRMPSRWSPWRPCRLRARQRRGRRPRRSGGSGGGPWTDSCRL